jgi:hypothetical protein
MHGIFIREGQNPRAQIYNTSGQLLLEKQLSYEYNILSLKEKTADLILIGIVSSAGSIKTFKIFMESGESGGRAMLISKIGNVIIVIF